MMDITTTFKNIKRKFIQLLPIGFSENKDAYIYCTDIVDGQFEMVTAFTK